MSENGIKIVRGSGNVFADLGLPNPDGELVLAQLRHAYMHLAAEWVVAQKELADGLIAPAIRYLEAALEGQKAD